MMGHSHAITGATAWLAVAGPAAGPLHLNGWGLAAGALVSAGAALLSDLDHAGATVSRSLPPITNVLSAVVSVISGGHRKGTHSVVGVALFTVLAWASAAWTMDFQGDTIHPGPAIASVMVASLGLKAMRLGFNPLVSWALSLGSGAAVFFTLAPGNPGWFPVAIGLGVIVHILGDMITTEGVPLLYPFSKFQFRFPILGDTGSLREHLLVGASSIAAVWLLFSAVSNTVGTVS